jgi:BirA family biotin operon repressor/biotin-[acetyl-CoA-carboxylase] ligase
MFAGMASSGANERETPRGSWPAWRVEHVDTTGSTNADLLAEARAGAPPGLVRVAAFQSAGRGRMGRVWEAAPGDCLLVSVLLRPDRASELHRLTQAVALAAADACALVGGFRPDLKWPNDLLVNERKLAGILAESLVEGRSVAAVVVGMGLNVRAAPPGAVSATEAAGRAVDRLELLDAFLGALSGLDPTVIATRYRSELGTLGRQVRVDTQGGIVEGRAVDVGTDGRLLIEGADGARTEIAAGDVVHLRG